MPFYVYRMYVRRVRRPGRDRARAPTLFLFEPHYALASTYAQEVVLQRISVPTIDGFQCPSVEQDAEQNALLKALLFTPWSCTDAQKCGCVSNFGHFLCNAGTAAERAADLRRGAAGDAPQLAKAPAPHGAPAPPRKYSFQRAWRLRRSELDVLAARADARRAASRKWLILPSRNASPNRNTVDGMFHMGRGRGNKRINDRPRCWVSMASCRRSLCMDRMRSCARRAMISLDESTALSMRIVRTANDTPIMDAF